MGRSRSPDRYRGRDYERDRDYYSSRSRVDDYERSSSRRDRERDRDRDRDYARDRERERDRDRDRDRDRERDREIKRERELLRRSYDSRYERDRSGPSTSRGNDAGGEAEEGPDYSKMELAEKVITKALQGESTQLDEQDIMKLMGFPGDFDSTKGKKVDGAANMEAAKIKTTRRARQFMNRRGGFNRELPSERTGEKIG